MLQYLECYLIIVLWHVFVNKNSHLRHREAARSVEVTDLIWKSSVSEKPHERSLCAWSDRVVLFLFAAHGK